MSRGRRSAMASRGRSGAFVLFRVAAGPRIGHGHLRRAETLAEAIGRPACVSIRGAGARTALPILAAGTADAALARTGAAVLVLDDPVTDAGRAWCRAAHRRGVPTVSIHDLGLAPVPSTLAIDGSVVRTRTDWPAGAVLEGLQYAVIRPPVRNRRSAGVRRVLISLGGGPRRALVAAIAAEVSRRLPGVEIIVPAPRTDSLWTRHARLVPAATGLADVLSQVDAAILGGGVSLYEAVAAGVPAVAVSVVPAQRPTIDGFAARGLVRDGGHAGGLRPAAIACTIADAFDRAAADADWRRQVGREGPRAIDGRGAARVARAILAVAEPCRA